MLFSLLKHYLELYITDNALKVSPSLYCFTTSISHGVKIISPGCGVRASLMLFPLFSMIFSIIFLSARQDLMRLPLLEITFFHFFFLSFFLSLDFLKLWHSARSTCFITEVKQQWATLVLGWIAI